MEELREQQELIEIREGSASILMNNDKEAFYNEVQSRNRDMTVLVLNSWGSAYLQEKSTKKRKAKNEESGLKILEALAATGLRSIRFAKEVACVGQIVANDLDPKAVEAINRNILHNGVGEVVKANCGDACAFMANHKGEFDVVDVDPYGSPSPFLDSALNCVTNGGLLCITATDMAVLCGNHPETCYARYHSVPLKAQFSHEMALRTVLYAIQSQATKYDLTIVPLLSCVMEFFVRIFVRVYRSKSSAKQALTKSSLIFYCPTCESPYIQPMGQIHSKGENDDGLISDTFGRLVKPPMNQKFTSHQLNVPEGGRCEICGSKVKIGGPIYTSGINNLEFAMELLSSIKEGGTWELAEKGRLKAILTGIAKENPSIPLFYSVTSMSKVLKTEEWALEKFLYIAAVFLLYCTDVLSSLTLNRSALLNAGYSVSRSHYKPNAFKTNAPVAVVWDIVAHYHNNETTKKIKHLTDVSKKILARVPSFEVTYGKQDIQDMVLKRSEKVYLPNPKRNWGPKTSAAKGLRKKRKIDE